MVTKSASAVDAPGVRVSPGSSWMAKWWVVVPLLFLSTWVTVVCNACAEPAVIAKPVLSNSVALKIFSILYFPDVGLYIPHVGAARIFFPYRSAMTLGVVRPARRRDRVPQSDGPLK